MPKILGNNYRIKPGETLPFEWSVQNSLGQPADNLGAAAFWLMQDTTRIKYVPAINGDVLSHTLDEAKTLTMAGIYRYECRCKDLDADVDHLKEGTIEVETDAVINEALVIPD